MQLVLLFLIITSFLAAADFFVSPATAWIPLESWQAVMIFSLIAPIAQLALTLKATATGPPPITDRTKKRIHWASEWVIPAIWILASFTICLSSRWGTLTRNVVGESGFFRFAFFLVPILLPLWLIWWLRAFSLSGSPRQSFREAGCRFKVYVLTIVVPILILIACKDVGDHFSGQAFLYINVFLVPICFTLILVGMPRIVSWILPTKSIRQTDLGETLLQLARQAKTPISDIRIWSTNHRMVNAIVVGLIPAGRTVLLTDRLVQEFELAEIKGIFLHEVGHAKRNHLSQRLAVAALPFFFTYALFDLATGSVYPALIFSILISLATLALVARYLEYDADRFAVEQMLKCGEPVERYLSALQRMRLDNPHADKPTWLHPRISDRIRKIHTLSLPRQKRPTT